MKISYLIRFWYCIICFLLVPISGSGKEINSKKTLVMGYDELTDLDPLKTKENHEIWTSLILFDQLVRVDKEGDVEPALASSWEIQQNNLVYLFHLRKGVRFWDGSPVTSEDVRFSLQRILTPENSLYFLFEIIKSIEAPDPHTVRITLKKHYTPLLATLSLFRTSIISKKHYLKDPKGFTKNPLGSGAFKIKQWKKSHPIILEKNNYYYQKGYPKLDQVILKPLQTNTDCTKLLTQKEVDICLLVDFQKVRDLQKRDHIKIQFSPSTLLEFIMLNQSFPPLKKKKVRKALAMALDLNELNIKLYSSFAIPANTYLPQIQYWNPYQAGYEYDPERAKELLRKAGYPNGFDLEVITIDTFSSLKMMKLIKKMWKEIGINLKIHHWTDSNKWIQAQFAGEYQSVWIYITSDIMTPNELTFAEVVSKKHGGMLAPGMSYENPEVDRLALQAVSTLDHEKRRQIYYRLQKLVHEDVPLIPLFYIPYAIGLNRSVQDFEVLPTGNFHLWEVWKQQ